MTIGRSGSRPTASGSPSPPVSPRISTRTPKRCGHRWWTHEGRRTLEVGRSADMNWGDVITAFSEQIARGVGEHNAWLFEMNFSTSTPIDRVAGRIVMMAAFKKYFDYLMAGICGIPEIELAGTPDDWRAIAERIERFSAFGLSSWSDALRPIAAEWVRTAEGDPNEDFWRAIYKPRAVYGGSEIRGWLTQLYPYLTRDQWNDAIGTGGPETAFIYAPNTIGVFPTGRSSATVRTADRDSFEMVGGLAGVTVDEGGWVSCASGWAVIRRPFSQLLDRISRDHQHTPPEEDDPARFVYSRSAHLAELYDRFGSVSFHGGRWRIRRDVDVGGGWNPEIVDVGGVEEELLNRSGALFADLEDGRIAALVPVDTTHEPFAEFWVALLPANRTDDDPPIIAKGLPEFLERVLEEGELPFVDEPDFVSDHLPAKEQVY